MHLHNNTYLTTQINELTATRIEITVYGTFLFTSFIRLIHWHALTNERSLLKYVVHLTRNIRDRCYARICRD